MKREKLVVIGNGMAGMKCVEEILKLEPHRFHITVFGSEPHPNYNRILLSKVLQGDSTIDSIVINDWSWYKEREIKLYTGETVVHLDIQAKQVTTLSGIRTNYDFLIIATGSSAFIPPIVGIHKPGVIAFRSMEDCATMIEYSKKYKKAAVIGGGLLGLEAARGLLNLGMQTEVIHNAPYLMNRQLDAMAADMLRRELEQQGMRFWLSKETESITGLNRAKGIRFSNGSTLEADLIVISVGIRPNITLAKESGLTTNRAIVVDDFMQTSDPSIYAVGECAEHRGVAYGLVAPLYEQGKVLAGSLCGTQAAGYEGSVPYAQLKVSGVEVFSVGSIQQGEADTALQVYDGIQGTYKKITMKDGKVSGAILFGSTAEGTSLLGLVKRGAPIAELAAKPKEDQSDEDSIAVSMPGRETVCACNAVTKSTIICAVTEDGLQTVEQVRDRTKASSSCGGCRPMVAAIVRYALRHDKESLAPAVTPICSCTALSHGMVKSAMKSGVFTSVQEVMETQGWLNPSGCSTCSDALTYYWTLYYPQPTNEASAQDRNKDSRQLTLHVPSPAISGFNTNLLAKHLHQACQYLTFPSSVKGAISSGIHSPAGVLVHDIGIAGSPAGWEIYAGGHAEHPVKQGQLIGIAESDSIAIELAIAILQLYREQAEYGEWVWKWLERTSINEIRELVLHVEQRMDLMSRAEAAASYLNNERLGERICSQSEKALR